MGEEVRGLPEAASLAGAGVGHYLASQRRLRGISLDELAGLTKIPRRSLERLEAGTFDTAPDGFVRGFVRSVALSLGLDPDEAVMRLMDEPAESSARPHSAQQAGRWLLSVAILGVVGALIAGLWLLVAPLFEPAPVVEPEDVIIRRDPVRSLAADAPPVAAPVVVPAPVPDTDADAAPAPN